MKILREKSLSTKILILYEIYTNHYSKLAPIAEKIGVTQQAISDYMKKMIQQDLVQKIDKEYKPTIKGTYLMQNELIQLKNSIDERIKNMTLVKDCIAFAKTKIEHQEPVGLFMEDGWLVAYANKESSSIGIAKKAANAGEYVTVGDLEGIIDHAVGKLYFYELPAPFNIQKNNVNVRSFQRLLQSSNIDKIGILDVVAKSMCQKIGIKPDFEFDATHAAIDSAHRGLNAALIGYKEKIRESIKLVEEINEKHNEKINYDLFSVK